MSRNLWTQASDSAAAAAVTVSYIISFAKAPLIRSTGAPVHHVILPYQTSNKVKYKNTIKLKNL